MMGSWMMGQGFGGPGVFGAGWWLWGILSMIFMVLVFAGIILLIVFLIRRLAGNANRSTASDALEILKKRYARGEISREEYEEIRRDIS